MHARSTVPNNPKNIYAKHPDGSMGRGIQYPFVEPLPGQYHEKWDGKLLDRWKLVVQSIIDYHYSNKGSSLEQITTEFIAPTDYGAGWKYSIFNNNVQCAKWMRKIANDAKLKYKNN